MTPWLRALAMRTPAAPALIAGNLVLDAATLAERTDTTARRLYAAGVRPGAHVALVAAPSVRVIETVHALQRLGAVLVPMGTRLVAPEVATLLALARPTLVLADAAHRDRVPSDALEVDGALDRIAAAPPSALADDVPADAVHTILFTSGTTGIPKGAVLTHANHHASARASAAQLGVTARDRWLACLPLHHVGGLAILVRGAVTGCAVILQPRFDPEAVLRAIRTDGVTMLSVVPTMLVRLLETAGDAPWPGHLRCVLVGGGPLPAPVAARARAAGVPIAPTYGLTEAASQVTTGAPGVAVPEPGWSGHPLPGTSIRIADPGPDGVGEILVRSPTVMRGYLDAPAGAAGVAGGWLRTGDAGRLAADGGLVVVGRRTDLVVTGGENVYPAEVEAVLLAHPAIADAGVYGEPDDAWGQRVRAAIVLRAPCDPGALRAWCATRLAPFKVPVAFEACTALPRTATGKLRRDRLATAGRS